MYAINHMCLTGVASPKTKQMFKYLNRLPN